MYKTILFSGLALAVAFGGPISFFRFSDFWRNVRQYVLGNSTSAEIEIDALKPADKSAGSYITSAGKPTLPLEGAPAPALAEVLRFDVSPAWVLQRWPRVSNDLARLQLHGYRVPLVTGTSVTDVAGSLTYYFNPAQRVEQITLHGTTGDPRALINILSSRYGYVRRPCNDPSRLIFETVNSRGQSAGTMIIQSAPVVSADRPLQRYAVELSMTKQ